MSSAAPVPLPRLIDGPDHAPATVLLAHGAGAPIESPFLAVLATGLAERGWRVVRFAFPYMARMAVSGRRQPPDRMPVLQEAFRQQVVLEREAAPERALILAGKSLGGRVASLLVDALAADQGVRGCLCFGYPFHPPGRPLQLRTEHLAALRTPCLILQGVRDPFGRREEVEALALSPQLSLGWIPAGDHSFRPNRSSGRSEAANLAMAVELADAFLRERLRA